MRDVEIRDLVLRLPGVSRADAREIAEDIARRLSETAAGWRETDVAELATLRVRVPGHARKDEIARLVAAEIARALR